MNIAVRLKLLDEANSFQESRLPAPHPPKYVSKEEKTCCGVMKQSYLMDPASRKV